MEKVTIQLESLTCPSCIQKIESAVQKQQGVAKVNVLFHAGKVKAEINNKETSADKLSEVIEKLGYTVENTKVQGV
ncbi:heavy metal-binding protein [Oceanobacillus oncorhynchi subsp. incaldanensis]|uniref:Heavy-metal-associated domain-containing protein n=1 Tax=Oceanobacillus aidingensis TaxID=645964 RepID=A0ABV9JZQ7_9BACI|nr:heavy-metal-associated domain-containing protein [Oceanobacillus oncorhynchi]MDM8098548.1 heavy-metal-associated domain-containing protein [Oceanobacillus oncorhynchi]UUI39006.1 cation transporter [Oceanobacillus oncorhynchi]GIO19203.1 heavy metal-binding protein [Oceanobacillus oncorhynchi subsp. incaldanensis]